MSKTFNVTTQELVNAANFMQRSHDEITSIFQNTAVQVQNLQNSGAWGGQASQSFQEWYNDFKGGYDKMMLALKSFHEATTTAAQAYHDTEQSVQNAFNNR